MLPTHAQLPEATDGIHRTDRCTDTGGMCICALSARITQCDLGRGSRMTFSKYYRVALGIASATGPGAARALVLGPRPRTTLVLTRP
jgi:hypothetical protein